MSDVMELVFLKELEPYSKEFLYDKLKLKEQDFNNFVSSLKSLSILKVDKVYKFKYVGLLQFESVTLFLVPKYVENEENYSRVMKEILALFKVYSTKEKLDSDEIETLGNFRIQDSFNLISLIDFLLRDYIEYDLYSNEKVSYDWNGSGGINWSRTIEESTAYLVKGNALYFDYRTNIVQNDEEDFIRKVHKYVLSKCFDFLEQTGLLEYLYFPKISFGSNEEELGPKDFILSKIRNELNIQFNDRKQLVLKAIYSFMEKQGTKGQENKLVIYGTRTFYNVWEKVCTFILGDEKNKAFRGIIDKPIWTDENGKDYPAKETLEPDIIREVELFAKKSFVIFDAKYYNILFKDGKLKNNPGVGDVTKQYLYELAYHDYLDNKGINQIYNVLLFPHDETEICKLGKVSMKFLSTIKLQDITLLVLPASTLYNLYVKNLKYNISEFESLINVAK
jgi:hypothetical protein